MAITKLSIPLDFPRHQRGCIEALLEGSPDELPRWIEIPSMPGSPRAVLIECDHASDATDIVNVLAALGWEGRIKTGDPGADWASARRRLTSLILGDGRAELRRYEQARERWERSQLPDGVCAAGAPV
jgi:hypothetical protein